MAKTSAMARIRDFLSQRTPSPALLDPCRYDIDGLLEGLNPDLHIQELVRAPPIKEYLKWERASGPIIDLNSLAAAISGRKKDPLSYNLALAMRWEEDRRSHGMEPMFRYFSAVEAEKVMAMRSALRWRQGQPRPDRDHLALIVLEGDGSFSRFNINPTNCMTPVCSERKAIMGRQRIDDIIKKHPNGAHAYFYVHSSGGSEDQSSKFYVRDFLTYSDEIERRTMDGAKRPISDLEQYLEDTLPTQFYDALEEVSFGLTDIYQHMLSLCGRAKAEEESPSKQAAEWVAKMIPCQPTGKAERSAEEMWTIFTGTLGAAKKEEVVQILEGFKTGPGLGIGEYGFLRINKVAAKGGSSAGASMKKPGAGAR